MVAFVSVLGLGAVVVFRRIDVGVTIGAEMRAVGGGWVVIVTGKNVDVLRNEVVDEFGDNGFKWYRWRFRVCVGFAGIKMWWVGPTSEIGDDVDGRNVLFPMWKELKWWIFGKIFSSSFFHTMWNLLQVFTNDNHLCINIWTK